MSDNLEKCIIRLPKPNNVRELMESAGHMAKFLHESCQQAKAPIIAALKPFVMTGGPIEHILKSFVETVEA